MKLNKLALILGLFLLPILANAQENKTQQASENVNRIITQANENGVTFIVETSLDSTTIEAIKQDIEREIEKQKQEQKRRQVYNNLLPKLRNEIAKKCIIPVTEEQFQDLAKNIVNCYGTNCWLPRDIICDTQYLYALNIHDTVDYDYGNYAYSEWQIVQYSISLGKIISRTDYAEGNGRFSTFKELKAQSDFAPVFKCQLARKVFSVMDNQEQLKKELQK